jgi:hypothetical protein
MQKIQSLQINGAEVDPQRDYLHLASSYHLGGSNPFSVVELVNFTIGKGHGTSGILRKNHYRYTNRSI